MQGLPPPRSPATPTSTSTKEEEEDVEELESPRERSSSGGGGGEGRSAFRQVCIHGDTLADPCHQVRPAKLKMSPKLTEKEKHVWRPY